MLSLTWLTLALSALTCAQPTLQARDDDGNDPEIWTPTLRTYYEILGMKVEKIRDAPGFPGAPECKLSITTRPITNPPLPTPAAGQELMHVAIGRGTQNYTCADSSSSAKPVPIGARAKLYNASCFAGPYPDLVEQMSRVALQYVVPENEQKFKPLGLELSGHHFFPDATSPTFDMNTRIDAFGFCIAGKKAASPAPSNAAKGPNGQGYGAVPWLYLEAKAGSTGFKTVYRLHTAGGLPPPTCDGMGPTFEVQYAAQYWFYQ